MRAGDFHGYLRNFHALRSQLNPALAEPALTFAFTRGLTPEFEQEVLYLRAADLPKPSNVPYFMTAPGGLEHHLRLVVLCSRRMLGTCLFSHHHLGVNIPPIPVQVHIQFLHSGGILPTRNLLLARFLKILAESKALQSHLSIRPKCDQNSV